MICDRCLDNNFEIYNYSLNGKTLNLCAYCLEHVKKHGELIPPEVVYVKQRKCNKCNKIILPHEYFYYTQDWEDISKSLGYFCDECVSELDKVAKEEIPSKTLVWTATQACMYAKKVE